MADLKIKPVIYNIAYYPTEDIKARSRYIPVCLTGINSYQMLSIP